MDVTEFIDALLPRHFILWVFLCFIAVTQVDKNLVERQAINLNKQINECSLLHSAQFINLGTSTPIHQ